MLKFIPVLSLMCIFRVISFSIGGGGMMISSIALPVVVLFFLKLCLPSLSALTPFDIFQGVLGELSSPSVWGTLGRENSRNVQLGMAIWHLIVNTLVLIMFLMDFGGSGWGLMMKSDTSILTQSQL